MEVMIPRNTPIPYTKTEKFANQVDNQQSIKTEIYEGERPMAEDNHLLGTFEMKVLFPGKAGSCCFEDTFSVDEDGILTVMSREKKTSGGNQNWTMKQIESNKGRLDEETVDRLVMEAKKMEKQDIEHKKKQTGKVKIQTIQNNIEEVCNCHANESKLKELSNLISNYLNGQFDDHDGNQVQAKVSFFEQEFKNLKWYSPLN